MANRLNNCQLIATCHLSNCQLKKKVLENYDGEKKASAHVGAFSIETNFAKSTFFPIHQQLQHMAQVFAVFSPPICSRQIYLAGLIEKQSAK